MKSQIGQPGVRGVEFRQELADAPGIGDLIEVHFGQALAVHKGLGHGEELLAEVFGLVFEGGVALAGFHEVGENAAAGGDFFVTARGVSRVAEWRSGFVRTIVGPAGERDGAGSLCGVTIVAMTNVNPAVEAGTELEVPAEKVAGTVELLGKVDRHARDMGMPLSLALRQAAWLFLRRHGPSGESGAGLAQAP